MDSDKRDQAQRARYKKASKALGRAAQDAKLTLAEVAKASFYFSLADATKFEEEAKKAMEDLAGAIARIERLEKNVETLRYYQDCNGQYQMRRREGVVY